MDQELGGDPPCWQHLLEGEDESAETPHAMRITIQVKRVYDPPAPADGQRILVDRLWPRGLKKEAARIDEWLRDVAPSDALRRWYNHDIARWPAFVQRYRAELAEPGRQAALAKLLARARQGPLTLLCAARDDTHSNAAVLRDYLLEQLAASADAP